MIHVPKKFPKGEPTIPIENKIIVAGPSNHLALPIETGRFL